MEPRKIEKPVESRGEGQTPPPRPPEQAPPKRFRIIKLEERIAPTQGGIGTGGPHTGKCAPGSS
jgi:hypothetical protein